MLNEDYAEPVMSIRTKLRCLSVYEIGKDEEDDNEERYCTGNNERSLTSFYDKQHVFQYFNSGETNGVVGEFEEIIKLNYREPISRGYFYRLWREAFPLLLTESDRPQCSQCAKHNEIIHNAIVAKDFHLKETERAKKDEHLRQAREVFCLSMDSRLRAKNIRQYSSFVIDNMSSKVLPKRRKETCDAWAEDRMVVHLGGVYEDKTDNAFYSLYPEIIAENTDQSRNTMKLIQLLIILQQ